jgi:hypothetical protein
MSETTYWASPTDRRRDGIPVDSARDAECLHHRHGLTLFGVTHD